jgi:hypothetical protein
MVIPVPVNSGRPGLCTALGALDPMKRSLPLRRLIRDYRPCSAAGPVRLGATPLPIQCHSPPQRLARLPGLLLVRSMPR